MPASRAGEQIGLRPGGGFSWCTLLSSNRACADDNAPAKRWQLPERFVAGQWQLKWLDLEGDGVTDATLESLRGLKNLEYLAVGSKMTDGVVKYVAGALWSQINCES